MNSIPNFIPERLTAARLHRGYKYQVDLARALIAWANEDPHRPTFSPSCVNHWEKGVNKPDSQHLAGLVAVLDRPREYFTGEDPEEKIAEYWAQQIEKYERKRLEDKGFRPAFFELLANEYNCTIETRGAWIRPGSGRFGVAPEEDLDLGRFDIMVDAVNGVKLLPERRADTDYGIEAADFEDDGDPETVPAAVFHVAGKGKEFALSLEELLQLQRILGGFIRSYIEEKSAKISSAEPIRQRVEVSEDSAGNGSGSQRDSSGSGSGSK